MDKENSKKSLLERYTELSKNSLIKMQYSCGGNSTSIDEQENISIVPESYVPENSVTYSLADEQDASAIVELLKTNNLPTRDLQSGRRIFYVARLGERIIGCVAIEIYGDFGLLRSLAVNNNFRGKGVGQKLVTKAEILSKDNGVKILYLLTTTAAGFFPKIGWNKTERASVPENISLSSEFASVCPSTAVCLSKTLSIE